MLTLPSSLTLRESAIVDAMREGMTSKEIARALNLSPRTVDTYRARSMAKTGGVECGALVVVIGKR